VGTYFRDTPDTYVAPRHFASHIHVLNREVPFILNITVPEVNTRSSLMPHICIPIHHKAPGGQYYDYVVVGVYRLPSGLYESWMIHPRPHDCRDAGGRAMQEQLPRDGFTPGPEGRRYTSDTADWQRFDAGNPQYLRKSRCVVD